MAAEWNFNVPRNYYTVFGLVSQGNSKRYNFCQLWVGDTLNSWFGIVPSNQWLRFIPKVGTDIPYTLKAFSQILSSTSAGASDVQAEQVQEADPTDQSWIITLRGDEDVAVIISLLVTLHDPQYGPEKPLETMAAHSPADAAPCPPVADADFV